jgi:hypothetical protein
LPYRRPTEQRDEVPAFHSITLSAICWRCNGTLIPSALAVLRLMTSSNLLGCKTGKPAGLATLEDARALPSDFHLRVVATLCVRIRRRCASPNMIMWSRLCLLQTWRPINLVISGALRARVLCIDYRLAPEYPFPAAIEDVTAVYRWIRSALTPPASTTISSVPRGGGGTRCAKRTTRRRTSSI